MADTSQILNEAYQYIEDGDFQAARELLEDHLAANEDNPDYWWVYAHAVETDEEGRAALQRLLELDPAYPGARTLLSQISPAPELVTSPAAPPPPPLDEGSALAMGDFDDFPEEDFPGDQPAQSRSLMPLLLGATALAIVLLLAIFLLPNLLGGGQPEATPTTSIVSQPTARPLVDDLTETLEPVMDGTEEVIVADTPTDTMPTEEETEPATQDSQASLFSTATPTAEEAEPTNTPTEEIAEETATPAIVVEDTEIPETEDVEVQEDNTEAPTDTPEESILATPTQEEILPTATPVPTEDPFYGLDGDALAEASVPEDGISTVETSLGNTLLLTICAPAGPQASAAIRDVIDVVLENEANVPEDIDGFGFAITDCDTNAVSRTVGFSRDAMNDTDGTATGVQALLRPIN